MVPIAADNEHVDQTTLCCYCSFNLQSVRRQQQVSFGSLSGFCKMSALGGSVSTDEIRSDLMEIIPTY